MRDAARAKQALVDKNNPDSIEWIVPGRIEETRSAATPKREVRG